MTLTRLTPATDDITMVYMMNETTFADVLYAINEAAKAPTPRTPSRPYDVAREDEMWRALGESTRAEVEASEVSR